MNNAVQMTAELMALSARTAPKATGQDYIVTEIVTGARLRELGEAMIRYGEASGRKNFDRDGKNTMECGAVLLIGLRDAAPIARNCGACGTDSCAELGALRQGSEFAGPFCAWRLMDLGIALGSAVKTASLLNVDNRIMYRVGAVARKLGLIEADVAAGIPLSATGKSPFFDR